MTVSTSRDPARIAGMFDAIARRYDLLNHVLSLGLDRRWRRRAVRDLAFTGRERVIDVCTGTGDLAIEAITSRTGAARDVVGIDFAGQMLQVAKAKVAAAGLADRARFVRGDATRLPCPDASADAVTVGFGIRNVIDPAAACREFFRILKPGGRLAILEFGMPRIPGIRAAYRAYFTHVLPRVGGLVSRHGDAYSYLPASVQQFMTPGEFSALLRAEGFSDVTAVRLLFGVVYLHMATRP
ncbi:MAG TPA: bifunctional demethylmenaquinone methyltransferase/2-methoxy-6-polyprenyl-1,4-benzoquinol methylase UbiE [Vicinamibacterales bacterium]|nr:bifunctional demethylmenaquinone methyltransferase/2-methoxy-6-polyprenyl-1,4-benzoquinol methylase UbiE [Vicinamibacterales bacterium]